MIGAYDRAVAEDIASLLEAGKRAVRALRETVLWSCLDYLGPEKLPINCNTPEDFGAAKRSSDAACRTSEDFQTLK